MTLSEYCDKQIPEYYPTMYMDGYTPEQILYAAHRKMYESHQVQESAKAAEEETNEVPEVKITSVVKPK